jgi:predicted RNase H-like nuclease/tetratricopeptide (TPR) repeat protein
MRAVGVDGCSKGWIAVVLRDGKFDRALFAPTIKNVLELEPDAAIVGVDIPIGAAANRFREVDVAARSFVGPRWQSVFETPPGPVIKEPSYEAALAHCRKLTGRGLSKQSYALREKVLEVAAVVAPEDRVIDVHPEVSFRALQGNPLLAPKSTWAGHVLRRALLERVGIVLPADLGEAGLEGATDDVLDAAVAAWSAHRHGKTESQHLEPAARDASGRLVTIWFKDLRPRRRTSSEPPVAPRCGTVVAVSDGLNEERDAERALRLAEQAAPELTGPAQAEWLGQLDAEEATLSHALRFYAGHPGGVDPGLRLVAALARFWWIRGRAREGLIWTLGALARPGGSPTARAGALHAAGALAYALSDYAAARGHLEAAIAAWEALERPADAAASLDTLGLVARERGDLAAAVALHEEALARYRAAGSRWGEASAIGNLGVAARLRGDFLAARRLYEESLAIRRAIGDLTGVASALGNLGLVARHEGRLEAAVLLYEESLSLRRTLGDRWGVAGSLNSLGALSRQRADWAAAQALHEEALEITRALNHRPRFSNNITPPLDLPPCG